MNLISAQMGSSIHAFYLEKYISWTNYDIHRQDLLTVNKGIARMENIISMTSKYPVKKGYKS